MTKQWWLAPFLSALLMAACGGGDPGTTSGGIDTAGVGSGGTGSFSSGAITGFGSIVVNGIHYDPSQAAIKGADDEQADQRQAQDLKLGMVVEVDGSGVTPVQGQQVATAQAVRFASALLGVVDAVSADSLTVMGQTVRVVDAATRFDDQLPQGLQSLSQGDVVEVYGFHDTASDTYLATRIERKDPAAVAFYRVQGVIQDLDLPGKRCRIGRQWISYDWKNATASLVNGQVARAKLYPAKVPVVMGQSSVDGWAATRMYLTQPLVTDRDQAYVDGLVTNVTPGAGSLFSVNGIQVDASQIVCPACAGLSVGASVSVKGRLQGSVIQASSVTRLP